MTSRQGPGPSAQHRPLQDAAGGVPKGAVPVVVLLSADWAGPSRPAPTLLRELARRWGPSMTTLLMEDPSDEILDRWDVTHLPTWLRFDPAGAPHTSSDTGGPTRKERHAAEPPDGEKSRVEADRDVHGSRDRDDHEAPESESPLREEILGGLSPGGEEFTLPGPWVLTHRRSGALPKHVVESEFGPGSGC